MKKEFSYNGYFVTVDIPLNRFTLTEFNSLTYVGTEVFEDGGKCMNDIDFIEAHIVATYFSSRNINIGKEIECSIVRFDNMKKIFLFLFNHKIQNNMGLAIVVDDIESIRNKILSQPLIFIYPSPNLNRTAIEVDLSPLLTILE